MTVFNTHINGRVFFLFVSESILLFAGVLFAAWIRFGFSWEAVIVYRTIPRALIIVFICQMTLYYSDLYALKGRRGLTETLLSFLQAMGLSYIILALVYYILPGLIIGRGIGIMSFLLLILLLTGWRRLFDSFLLAPQMKERVLIMGSGDIARELALEIMNDPGCGMQVVGFLSAELSEVGKSVVNPRVLGSMDDMYRIVKENRIDRLVVAMDERRGSLPVREILRCKFEGVAVQEGTALMEQLSGKILVQNLRPSWIIFSEGFKKGELTKRIKWIIDLLVSSILIFLTWPFMVLTAIAIKLESPGPVLYRQKRIGQWNREFSLLKFRSMIVDAETNGAQWAVKNDVRVTRVGRIIRKLRLDELPQLYNVFKGQMSLVGPRPERPEFVTQLREKIPYYDERHSVKPGVTGWAQVQFSYGNTVEDSQEKLEYDLFYIKNLSPLLDLVIIFQTIKVVLLGRGAL